MGEQWRPPSLPGKRGPCTYQAGEEEVLGQGRGRPSRSLLQGPGWLPGRLPLLLLGSPWPQGCQVLQDTRRGCEQRLRGEILDELPFPPVTRDPPRRLLPAFAGVPVGEAAAGVQVPPGLIVCDCSHSALGRGWCAVFAQTPAAADIKLQSDTTPRALTVVSA